MKPGQSRLDATASLKRAEEQDRAILGFDAVQASRVRRLGGAIVALTQELAVTRRELHKLRRENAQLRRRLDADRTSPSG